MENALSPQKKLSCNNSKPILAYYRTSVYIWGSPAVNELRDTEGYDIVVDLNPYSALLKVFKVTVFFLFNIIIDYTQVAPTVTVFFFFFFLQQIEFLYP